MLGVETPKPIFFPQIFNQFPISALFHLKRKIINQVIQSRREVPFPHKLPDWRKSIKSVDPHISVDLHFSVIFRK